MAAMTVKCQDMISGNQPYPHPCWICLNSTDHNHFESTSFQMLLRYLGIKLIKLWETSIQNNFNAEEKLCLCERCSLKVDQFWILYQEFEAIRLALDDSIDSLHKLITDSKAAASVEPDINRDVRKETNVVADEIITLRIETLKKCYLKTRNAPRVKLCKLACEKHTCDEQMSNFDEVANTPLTSSESDAQDDQPSSPVYNFEDETTPDNPNTNESLVNEKLDDQVLIGENEDLANCDNPMNVRSSSKKGVVSSETRLKSKSNKRQEWINLPTCNFCRYTGTGQPSVMRIHLVLSHTLEFYSDLIPSGTTRPELHAATYSATVEKHLAHPKNHDRLETKVINCASCLKIFRRSTTSVLKCHIVQHHNGEVITTLNEKRLQLQLQTPSSDATNDTKILVKFEPMEVSFSSNDIVTGETATTTSTLPSRHHVYRVKIVKRSLSKLTTTGNFKCDSDN